MASTKGPIMPRRRLGNELKLLREESGRTLDEVAQALLISTSKLSRLENAQGSPQARDVRDLANYYGVGEGLEGRRLMAWAREGRRTAWWADYEDIIQRSPAFDVYLAYETEATSNRVYTIPYVTGLLQTAGYARALTKAIWPWCSSEEVDRFVRLRLRRQAGLKHREALPPLELRAIMHESCLTQLVGSPEIMRDQLEALLTLPSKLPKVSLRVLPARAEPHQMNTCIWSYFILPDFDGDVVNIETPAGYRYIEGSDAIKRYDRAWSELTDRSLDSDESAKLIHLTMQNW
jgi:transcriptional regulator with XRE-family HTH domain